MKIRYLKKPILALLAVSFVLSGTPFLAMAQTLNTGGNPEVLVCDVLTSIGLGCGVSQPAPSTAEHPSADIDSPLSPVPNGTAAQRDSVQPWQQDGSLQASIANVTVKRSASKDEVMLVKVPAYGVVRPTLGLETNDAIFEIIRGQKHFIPTVDVFFDYGFDLAAVQSVTHNDLELFPRTKLVNVYKGGKNIHYITETHMIRLVPDNFVFDSYGDRKEDIITISKKEFNFYPRNQYVFLQNSLDAVSVEIFQISDNGTKRYVVPQVVKRLRITQNQVAPINRAQFEAYDYGTPIIF